MKKKLANIFKEKCITDTIPADAQNYHWYLDENHKAIGISKEITTTELALIDLLYTRIGINKITDIDKLQWLLFLTEKTPEIPLKTPDTTHMKWIFFSHAFDPDEQLEFDELVQSFNQTFKVIFLDSKYGVILDLSVENKVDTAEVEDFLLASIQDFSNGLSFYQTMSYEINKWLPGKFSVELAVFKNFKNSNQQLMNHKDIFLNYLISSEVLAQYPIFGDWFKDILVIDAEFLAVVKCYLENGFNITTGAKMMHMHRNTFMNKLDRFVEMTNLDIKHFDEAVIAYLLIQLRRDV